MGELLDSEKIDFLRRKAYELRLSSMNMIWHGGSGHPGGSLSIAEIVACLYYEEMQVFPSQPRYPWRDRLVLSKGHSAPIVYAALADLAFFPEEELRTLRHIGSNLQGHPCMKKTPGIDMTTGSLGQGLSAATGMALALRHHKKAERQYRVYAILSDGELQEGMSWEAAMSAAHYRTDNLAAIVDYNNLQVDGRVDQIMGIEPLEDKWKSFGWRTFTCNGHDVAAILDRLVRMREVKGSPSVLIAKTVKGKGVSFMENVMEWHANPLTHDCFNQSMLELQAAYDALAAEPVQG